jgi:hypothetical protein
LLYFPSLKFLSSAVESKTWRHHAPDSLDRDPPASAGIRRKPSEDVAPYKPSTFSTRFFDGIRRHPAASAGILRTRADVVGRRPELATASDRAKILIDNFWLYVSW